MPYRLVIDVPPGICGGAWWPWVCALRAAIAAGATVARIESDSGRLIYSITAANGGEARKAADEDCGGQITLEGEFLWCHGHY